MKGGADGNRIIGVGPMGAGLFDEGTYLFICYPEGETMPQVGIMNGIGSAPAGVYDRTAKEGKRGIETAGILAELDEEGKALSILHDRVQHLEVTIGPILRNEPPFGDVGNAAATPMPGSVLGRLQIMNESIRLLAAMVERMTQRVEL